MDLLLEYYKCRKQLSGGGGREGGSLITNSKKLFSFAPLLQYRLTSFSPPPQPLSPPLIRCKKDPIIVFLRCLQNYGVSGGGRLNKWRGVKNLVILKLF